MAVDPRHHDIGDHAIDPAAAGLLQRARTYQKHLDRFFAVRRKVIFPDTQRPITMRNTPRINLLSSASRQCIRLKS